MPQRLINRQAIACSLIASALFATVVRGQAPTDSDWARVVPSDARFYSEMRNLGDAREIFRKLNIWDLIRDLGERDRPGSTTRPWSDRTQQLLGMNTDDAVKRLLSKRAGLIATEAAQWQNGVVLGELESESQLSELLKTWDAKPLREEGEVKCFTLRGELRLAVCRRMIALGPKDDPDGLWGRTVLLMAGTRGPYLSGRAEFASLRSRMTHEHEGLIYTFWEENDPGSVAGCRRLMAAFDVKPEGIQAELHGQRYSPLQEEPYDGYPLEKLPASTLAAYAGRQEFSHIFGKKFDEGNIDTRSLVEVFLGLFAHGEESPVNLLTQLGPNYLVAISGEESQGMSMPAAALLCDSSKPVEHMRQLDQVIGFFAALIASINESPVATSRPDASLQKTMTEGIELHHVNVGPSLARRLNLEFLQSVSPAWAVVDGRILIASSRRYAEEIIRSGLGKSPSLKIEKDKMGKPTELIVVRGTETARMLKSWLDYIKSQHPRAQSKVWWQDWAQAQFEKTTELGVAVQSDHGRAAIREIKPSSPANNLLKYQDVIVAVAGKPLDPEQPARDLAQRYRNRGSSREFVVEVVREGKYVTVPIPVIPADALDVSDLDPVLDLTRLQTLLAKVSQLTLMRYSTKPDRLDATLNIKWNAGS